MSRKSYKRHDRIFTGLITILSLCAVGLVVAIAVQSKLNIRPDVTAQVMSNHPGSTHAPVNIVSLDVQATPTPQFTAAPAPTDEPFEYLPIYSYADTEEPVIAITLDDCSHLPSLKYAATAAEKYGAKLTLLPVASELLKTENAEALQYCVFNLGYQVENRTLNNVSLYSLNDFQMASEIWTADTAVDFALNKDYSMHLLRTRGGQGLLDPRTHAYLKQLGYDGLLTWSFSGTSNDIEALKDSLKPGQIYLFNCTKDDVLKLEAFMKFAKNRGYSMVTVNELLGFDENACVDPTGNIMARTLPELENYTEPRQQYSDGDRTYGVYKLQQMLVELGYLNISSPQPSNGSTPEPTQHADYVSAMEKLADGVYGQGTSKAIMAFQASRGMPCTGLATIEIQNMIAEEYAARFNGAADPAPTAAPAQ